MAQIREYPATEHCLGEVSTLPDAPDWIYELDNPYLHGVYAPTVNEMQVEDLRVTGELPMDLVGAYFRNGPNPRGEVDPAFGGHHQRQFADRDLGDGPATRWRIRHQERHRTDRRSPYHPGDDRSANHHNSLSAI